MDIRVDKTGFGDIIIKQRPMEFCYGVDAVLLAHEGSKYSSQKDSERIIDLGSGTGIVPLILSHKTKSNHIYGVELQTNSYNLCIENVKANKLESRLDFLNCNVKDLVEAMERQGNDKETAGETGKENNEFVEKAKAMKGSFDLVTSNPPYTAGSCGLTSKNQAKAIARHEIYGSLEDFMRCGAMLLKDKGHFVMIHRPNRLVDICYLGRKYKVEPKHVEFLAGKKGEKPNLVIVHFVKNGSPEIKVEAASYIREKNGEYSERALGAYC